MTTTQLSPQAEVQALTAAVRERRQDLAAGGFRSDRDNADPAGNFALLAELGAGRLLVPAEFGGLWDGTPVGGWGDLIRCYVEVCAGDGATGQDWGTTALVAREVLGPDSGLPQQTKAEIARRILHEDLRLVASNAETGAGAPVTARRVDGGVILSGTKSFNTNSAGLGIGSVGCVLEGQPGRHHVLVELRDNPAVELHDDWDNMGQRGTRSQAITYHDVFVPDGWHYGAHAPSPAFFGAVMLLHATLMQGIGDGALDEMVRHARTMKRGTLPQFDTMAEDPLVLRRIGGLSSRLAASRALLFAAADAIETAAGPGIAAASVDCVRAKVACVEASLAAAGSIHEVTGARSTSNQFRLDRYWRNARTFASHDPTDAKNIYVGMYEMSGQLPPLTAIIKI